MQIYDPIGQALVRKSKSSVPLLKYRQSTVPGSPTDGDIWLETLVGDIIPRYPWLWTWKASANRWLSFNVLPLDFLAGNISTTTNLGDGLKLLPIKQTDFDVWIEEFTLSARPTTTTHNTTNFLTLSFNYKNTANISTVIDSSINSQTWTATNFFQQTVTPATQLLSLSGATPPCVFTFSFILTGTGVGFFSANISIIRRIARR
jgi:hypothetical protein